MTIKFEAKRFENETTIKLSIKFDNRELYLNDINLQGDYIIDDFNYCDDAYYHISRIKIMRTHFDCSFADDLYYDIDFFDVGDHAKDYQIGDYTFKYSTTPEIVHKNGFRYVDGSCLVDGSCANYENFLSCLRFIRSEIIDLQNRCLITCLSYYPEKAHLLKTFYESKYSSDEFKKLYESQKGLRPIFKYTKKNDVDTYELSIRDDDGSCFKMRDFVLNLPVDYNKERWMESLNGIIYYQHVNDEGGASNNTNVVWEGIRDSLFYSCNKFDDDGFYEKYHIKYPDLDRIKELENGEDNICFDNLGGLFIKFTPEFVNFHCYESDKYREAIESSNFKIKRTKIVDKIVAKFLKSVRHHMFRLHNKFVIDLYKTNSKNTELLRPTFEYFSKWEHCNNQFKKLFEKDEPLSEGITI